MICCAVIMKGKNRTALLFSGAVSADPLDAVVASGLVAAADGKTYVFPDVIN
jgi:hypothetical protein